MSPRRLAVLYPLAFACFPVFSLFSANLGLHPLRALAAPLVASLLFAALALALARLTTREPLLVALRAFALLVLFFAAGRVRAQLPYYAQLPLLEWWAWPRHIADVAFALAAGLLSLVRPRNLVRLTVVLSVATAALVVAAVAPVARSWSSSAPGGPPRQASQASSAATPHVFYIILDGYGREDVLRETFGFDNSGFRHALRERGFFVAASARANYSQTLLSVASTLNMDYLEAFVAKPPWRHDRTPLVRSLEQNRVMQVFRAHGYSTVSLTGGGPLELRADRSLRVSAVDEFFEGFLELTPVPPLRRAMRAGERALRGHGSQASWRDGHRQQVLETLGGIAGFAAERQPVFVVAHVLAPHPPFVFDRNGALPANVLAEPDTQMVDGDEWRRQTGLDAAAYRQRYVEQLRYVNARALAVVDEILSRASRPVVILLQGDHGPASGLTWHLPHETDMRERLGILSAYRFPDGSDSGLYPSISPVNSFRLVLSRVLGSDLPALPDRSFFSTWTDPYDSIPLLPEADGTISIERPRERTLPIRPGS